MLHRAQGNVPAGNALAMLANGVHHSVPYTQRHDGYGNAVTQRHDGYGNAVAVVGGIGSSASMVPGE